MSSLWSKWLKPTKLQKEQTMDKRLKMELHEPEEYTIDKKMVMGRPKEQTMEKRLGTFLEIFGYSQTCSDFMDGCAGSPSCAR
ncbi:hypothetical protein FRX31_009940 [Thalictrum thalictroides]|uniref:Uncharacterized protein n=1 Tax=Thalictrum thalictroides TaxID=46969 RepID=A0A7J6WTX7_THATH|nr:hypothetical protein FRX31_009940 [Thalictrum thalictroides]